jgi:hypothetical protein
MNIALRSGLLSAVVTSVVAACSSSSSKSAGTQQGTDASTSTGTDGATSMGSDAGTNSSSDAGIDGGSDGEFLGNGTFTATGAEAGSASATLAGFQISIANFLTSTNVYQFSVAATEGDGTSSATFSSPSGIGSYTFTSSVIFTGAPKAGASYTVSNSCGSTGISYGPATRSFEYNFTATFDGANCTTVSAPNAGSWTLSLASVAQSAAAVGSIYTAHGTFTSIMPDGMGDTGTINLTF